MIDTSEDARVVRMFMDDPEFEVLQMDLPVADYVFGSGVAVERKEDDFFGSLAGHKLDRQLAELKANYPRCILVIIGGMADKVKWSKGIQVFQTAGNQMAWGLGSIAKFAIDYGVSVVQVADRKEFIEFMRHVGNHAKKFQSGDVQPIPSAPSVTFKKADRDLKGTQRDMLRAITRISAKKAEELLHRYGSPVEVAIAAQKGLISREVAGIGGKTEEELVRAFLIRAEQTATLKGDEGGFKSGAQAGPQG